MVMASRKKKIIHKKQVFDYYTKDHVDVYENFDDAVFFAEQAEWASFIQQFGLTDIGEIIRRSILK